MLLFFQQNFRAKVGGFDGLFFVQKNPESFSNTDQFAKTIKKIDLRFYVTKGCLLLLVFAISQSEVTIFQDQVRKR